MSTIVRVYIVFAPFSLQITYRSPSSYKMCAILIYIYVCLYMLICAKGETKKLCEIEKRILTEEIKYTAKHMQTRYVARSVSVDTSEQITHKKTRNIASAQHKYMTR